MESPRVSVIMPAYNGEKFIERAVRSVLIQTFQDFEIITIDDGSIDKTAEIIKRLQKEDSRIRLIELKENTGGPATPRTIACKEAKGEYIAFLDSDDLYYPEYLELKIKYLEKNPEVHILTSLAWTFDEETKEIINYEHGGPVNNLIKKKALEDGEYFKQKQNGVDEIGNVYRYILKNGLDRIKSISSKPLTLYSRHPLQGSYVENKDPVIFVKRIESLIEDITYEKINNLNRKLRKFFILAHGIWYAHLGNFYCLAGDLKKGRGFFIKSLKIKANLFSSGLLFLSFFGFRAYRKIEFFLRTFQRKIFWRLKTTIKILKYKTSYNKAREILTQYK
ncbi:MAG: glycosyltransferase family 2 protein [Candidatus Nealsonbacteria bacterium]|nr:glycosyltransferase family 2 protein [Candidatus Nealsonbacteria bacterium]